MDMKLELVLIPVSDVDRARDFYVEKVGFNLDVDQLDRVLARLAGQERLSLRTLGALALGMVGVAVLFETGARQGSAWGAAAVLAAGVFWSIGAVYEKEKKWDALLRHLQEFLTKYGSKRPDLQVMAHVKMEFPVGATLTL